MEASGFGLLTDEFVLASSDLAFKADALGWFKHIVEKEEFGVLGFKALETGTDDERKVFEFSDVDVVIKDALPDTSGWNIEGWTRVWLDERSGTVVVGLVPKKVFKFTAGLIWCEFKGAIGLIRVFATVGLDWETRGPIGIDPWFEIPIADGIEWRAFFDWWDGKLPLAVQDTRLLWFLAVVLLPSFSAI